MDRYNIRHTFGPDQIMELTGIAGDDLMRWTSQRC